MEEALAFRPEIPQRAAGFPAGAGGGTRRRPNGGSDWFSEEAGLGGEEQHALSFSEYQGCVVLVLGETIMSVVYFSSMEHCWV